MKIEKIHWLSKEKHYACNGACGITPEKTTRNKNKVTCLNCLRLFETFQREKYRFERKKVRVG